MSCKIVNIQVPKDANIPDISSCTIEENYLMLKLGYECLIEGRKLFANFKNDEIYKKLENEFDHKIKNLNDALEIEKNTSNLMQEKIKKIYESQIENLHKKLENTISQLETYKIDYNNSLNQEMDKIREKYEMLLQEKDKQNQLNREVFDKAEKLLNRTLNKSSSLIGETGEQMFENLAECFKDFVDYKIEKKSKQGHKGDFHLFFKNFNVLVDVKNYTGSVQKKEILKIESDLIMNSNMNYAWLVSLNSNICEYNRSPITPKWVTTDDGIVKCILMINNLLENKEPTNMLRQAWQMSEDFYKLTKNVAKEDGELEKYRDNFLIYKKQINKLQERSGELRRSMNVSQNILKNMDNDLVEILTLFSNEIINEKYAVDNVIKKWWDNTVEYTNDESKITSTDIWNRFKKDNKEYVSDNKITIEMFKEIITSNIVNSSNYVEKTKKSVIEFIGFKWREKEIKEIKDLIIENIIIKTPKKEKKIQFYFDEERDNKILKEYENEENDIVTMSNNDLRPWQIVSILMRYKIIKKRDEARGYDKYKQTEEYKSKINDSR